jgi:hypothetical protein
MHRRIGTFWKGNEREMKYGKEKERRRTHHLPYLFRRFQFFSPETRTIQLEMTSEI